MKIEKQVNKKPNAKININVKVDKKDVIKERESVIKDFEKNAKIHGFRKGKVPRNIIISKFSTDINNETINALFSKSISQIIKEENYNPISTPVITESGQFTEDEDFSFKTEFEVMPKVTLSEYKGIKSDKYIFEVNEDNVNKVIDNFREQFSILVSTDKKAEIGNYLVVDYEEKSEDGKLKNKKTNQTIFLDDKDDQLTRKLIGMKKGEEKDITLSKELEKESPSSTTTIHITVKDIKKKELPELNDDFAKDVSDVQTLEGFKKKTRTELEKEAKILSEKKTKAQLLKKVVENSKFDIPETMINNEIDHILSDIVYSYKLDLEKIKKDKKIFEEYRNKLRPRAVNTIKDELVLFEIAEKEGLEVTGEEVDNEIKSYASQNKKDYHSVKKSMVDNGTIENLKYRLKPTKALDFIYKNAILGKEKKLNYNEQEGEL